MKHIKLFESIDDANEKIVSRPCIVLAGTQLVNVEKSNTEDTAKLIKDDQSEGNLLVISSSGSLPGDSSFD